MDGGDRSSVDVKSWAVTLSAGLQVRPLMVMGAAVLASATQKSWSGSSSAAPTSCPGAVIHKATTRLRRISNIVEEEAREEAMSKKRNRSSVVTLIMCSRLCDMRLQRFRERLEELV